MNKKMTRKFYRLVAFHLILSIFLIFVNYEIKYFFSLFVIFTTHL